MPPRSFSRRFLYVLSLVLLGFPVFGTAGEPVVRADCMTGRPVPVWVFFTDKGLGDSQEERAALSAARSRLSERALRRRAKVRGPDVVDLRDVSVCNRYVEAVVETGAALRTTSRWINAVSVEATREQMDRIRRLPFVRELRPVARSRRDPPREEPEVRKGTTGSRYLLDYGESLCQVGPMQVPELHDQGLSGAGVLVCILDTGFRRIHTALGHVDVVAEWDFIQGDSVTDNQEGDESGQMRHGTEILSLIAGFEPGHLIGPAYAASYALAKTEEVYSETRADEDRWVAGIEWGDSLGADIVTSSLCYWEWYTYEDIDGNTAVTTIAGDLAVANGIVVCNAAGNAGASAWHYIMPASDGDSVLCIGAVDTFGVVTDFSSRGPTFDGRIKPDLVAVGDGNVVVKVWGTTGYNRENGTSCSSPLVAGVCALLLEAHPEWTPMQVAEALKMTATNTAAPDSLYGWGIPQGLAALGYAPTGVVESPTRIPSTGQPVLACYPNPSSGAMTFSLSMPDGLPAPGALEIFDVQGRLVARVFSSRTPAEAPLYRWDGCDLIGRTVPAGVYFARVEAAGQSATRRLVRVR